jgi:hypothetical protein
VQLNSQLLLSCPVLQVRAVVAEAKDAAQVGFWIEAMTQHKTTTTTAAAAAAAAVVGVLVQCSW